MFQILILYPLELCWPLSEVSNQGCCTDKVGVTIEFDGKNEVDLHTIGRHFHLQLKAIDTTTNG